MGGLGEPSPDHTEDRLPPLRDPSVIPRARWDVLLTNTRASSLPAWSMSIQVKSGITRLDSREVISPTWHPGWELVEVMWRDTA